jgi:hypothetical protein
MEVAFLPCSSPAGDDEHAVSLVDLACAPILGAGHYVYSEHAVLLVHPAYAPILGAVYSVYSELAASLVRTTFAPILGAGDYGVYSEHDVSLVRTAFAPVLEAGDYDVYSGSFVDNAFRLARAPFGAPFRPPFQLHASSCRGRLEVNESDSDLPSSRPAPPRRLVDGGRCSCCGHSRDLGHVNILPSRVLSDERVCVHLAKQFSSTSECFDGRVSFVRPDFDFPLFEDSSDILAGSLWDATCSIHRRLTWRWVKQSIQITCVLSFFVLIVRTA